MSSIQSPEATGTGPQAASLLATLRQQLREGRWPAGSRLSEAGVADALGVSRTPVRLAFKALEQEGLLHKTGKRGLVVRGFSAADVRSAVEVRGALESLAVQRIAEAGLPTDARLALEDAVARGRALLAAGHLQAADIELWGALNRQFHEALLAATQAVTGSSVITDALVRNNQLPFASADAIALDTGALAKEFARLQLAQLQHEFVLDALRRGDGTRAATWMREHALIGLMNASTDTEHHAAHNGQDNFA